MPALIKKPAVSRFVAEQIVARAKWFHRIEVLDGLTTPGHVPAAPAVHGTKQYMDSLGFGQDLSGLRILDVGTYDGPMAFELAQRGADVVAVDIRRATDTGFDALRKISGLDIPHVQISVYDLHKRFDSEFDAILLLGVFYHLKHPILAFENVAHALKMDGRVYIEGASFGTYLENIDGTRVVPGGTAALFAGLEELDKSGVPVCLAFPGSYLGGNNWFLPNRSALCGWMNAANLQVEMIYAVEGREGRRRIGARGKKIRHSAVAL